MYDVKVVANLETVNISAPVPADGYGHVSGSIVVTDVSGQQINETQTVPRAQIQLAP
jgi:hypothetical protein